MAETEEVLKDWHDLKHSLGELDGAVARLSNQKTGAPNKEVAHDRKRLPSVFSASCDRDLKLLNRCYSPNIFAWDLCRVGVEDDVDDLQLRVAYRLRRRAEELQKSDLEQLRQKQRQEMNEADEFMQGFDSQHWLQNQGPLPETGRCSAAGKPQETKPQRPAEKKRSEAGPLPRTLKSGRPKDDLPTWRSPRSPEEVLAPAWPRAEPFEHRSRAMADVMWPTRPMVPAWPAL